MAQTSLQRNILNRQRNFLDLDNSRAESCIFESAKRCSQILDKSIQQYKDSLASDIQSDAFMLVINAWFNAASSAMLQNNLQEGRAFVSLIVLYFFRIIL